MLAHVGTARKFHIFCAEERGDEASRGDEPGEMAALLPLPLITGCVEECDDGNVVWVVEPSTPQHGNGCADWSQ